MRSAIPSGWVATNRRSAPGVNPRLAPFDRVVGRADAHRGTWATWTPTGRPRRGRGAGSRCAYPPRPRYGRASAACAGRRRSREGRGWWASHHRRGLPRPPRYGSSAPQAGQWRGGARLARRAIVADAATASRASAVMHHPTGENPPKSRNPAEGTQPPGASQRSPRRPMGYPAPVVDAPFVELHERHSTACWRCRTAHRQRRAGRCDRRSGPRLGGRDAGSPGTSRRAHHARRGAPGR